MYFRMVPSSKPTVLTQYPRDQKWSPFTLFTFNTSRWIRTALFPFKKPIANAASYKLLCGLGCDIAQGYFINRPAPAPEFAEWYKKSGGIFKTEDRS